MDAQTITKLAKAHATLIIEYTSITQVEAINLASQIVQLVAGGLQGAGEPSTKEDTISTPAPTPRPTGSEMAAGEGAILAQPGYLSHCSSCKSDIYEVITEVRGKGMGVNAFCQAFRPIGHSAILTRDNLEVVKDNNGNTYMDCPSCRGKKTLRLLGKHSTETQKTGVAPVGSIGKGDVS